MKYFLLAVVLHLWSYAKAQEPSNNKIFFENSRMLGSYFYSDVSYANPSWIKNISKKLPVNDSAFFTPGNSLELNYVSASNGQWQARLLFRNNRGLDFFATTKILSMRLLMLSSTTVEELPEIAISDNDKSTSSFIPIQPYVKYFQLNKWLTVQIPLDQFKSFTKKIDSLNAIVFRQHGNDGHEHQLLLDQVEIINEDHTPVSARPFITSAEGYEKHVDITWNPVTDPAVKYVQIYRSTDEKNFYPVGIQSDFISRYADFTDTTGKKFYYRISFLNHDYRESAFSNIAGAETKTMTDEELLTMVQEAQFRYY